MKSTSDILRECKIEYATLDKYRRMGLVPKPDVERKGHRGARARYPDEVIGLIHWIEILKAKGFTLEQIAEIFRTKVVLNESALKLQEKINPDTMATFMRLGAEIERIYPDHDVIHAKGEVEDGADGEVVVMTKVVLMPKAKETNPEK
jgi:DNA-binding transcriptional MerR regulator